MLSHVNREACLLLGALCAPTPGSRHLGFQPYNPRPAGNSGGLAKLVWRMWGLTDLGQGRRGWLSHPFQCAVLFTLCL